MKDEFTLQRDKVRAEHAKRIVDDELVQAAFADIEAALIKAFRESGPSDAVIREDLWRVLDLQKKFRAIFTGHLRTGQVAIAEIAAIEKKRGPLKKLTEAFNG
jgi:hypothetical protein